MSKIFLTRRFEGKIWGRADLPDWVGPVPADKLPLGEMIFDAEPDHELLVKYLFTSQRLSIQVHPDNRFAAERGYERGKDEAWLILWAGPGAELGIGPVAPITRSDLKAAAFDGDIERLIRWWPVGIGDSFYAPAGTIHAIGGELILLEIQQNMDVTYRLYDYGRDRPLHLEEGLAVARTDPVQKARFPTRRLGEGRELIAEGPAFAVERWSGKRSLSIGEGESRCWLVPVTGSAELDGERLEPGRVWLLQGEARLMLGENSEMIVAYPGSG